MYKIDRVVIENFWGRAHAECEFRSDVNLIIGMNGTGKTTFMNILFAALTVSIDELSEAEFDSVELYLSHEESKKYIRIIKIDDETSPYQTYEYDVTGEKYRIRYISTEERRFSPNMRKRTLVDSEDLRHTLSDLVSLSSISVYRLRSGDEYEIRDRHGSTRMLSPVDYRLSNLLRQLTQFQLQLTQKVREVSIGLQRDVLLSILYSKEDEAEKGFNLNFDKEQERSSLMAAYKQLNALDSAARKKIESHVEAVEKTVNEIKDSSSNDLESQKPIDLGSLEAWRKTQNIIKMSLEAEEESSKIFAQLDLFLLTLKSFITDKEFKFESGSLVVSNKHGSIDHAKMSSGEKQLLILLIEALLQRKARHIFLADEPEISLHVDWQRRIIPAVRDLNPEAQVIVATHSPEVAAMYQEMIIDMQDVVNVKA